MKPFLFGLFATFFVLILVSYSLGFYLGTVSIRHALAHQDDCGMRFFYPCQFEVPK